MIKPIKTLKIIAIMFFPFFVLSCSSNSVNSANSSNINNIAKKYTWGKDIPKGPYFEHIDGGITTDKTKTKNYSPELIPPRIRLPNTLNNNPIEIDGIKYKPIKKELKIKWKKKNELKFYSSNEDLIGGSKFLKDIFKYEEVKTPNNISFENDLRNNFKKIKVDGKYVNPTKAEYWTHQVKKAYKFNDMYYSDKNDLIKKNFVIFNQIFSKETNEINLDGNITKLKPTYDFLKRVDQKKDYLATDDKSLFFISENNSDYKNKKILFNIRDYVLKEFNEANLTLFSSSGQYHNYNKLKLSNIDAGKNMEITFQEIGAPSRKESYLNIEVSSDGKIIFSESFINNWMSIDENKTKLIKLYKLLFDKDLKTSDFAFVYRDKLKNWEQDKINYFNLPFRLNVVNNGIKKQNNDNIKIYSAPKNISKSLNKIYFKLKNEEKYYSSIKKMNIITLDKPRFNSSLIEVDGREIPLMSIDSKIYFKNMNLKYKLNYLGISGEVPQFFTTYKKLLLDQNEKLNTIHDYEIVDTFPDDLSALNDSRNKFLLNGIRQASLFLWNNLPENFYLLKGKRRSENIFTTNYKMAEGYKFEVAKEINLPDPNSLNSSNGISIDGKHFKRIKLS